MEKNLSNEKSLLRRMIRERLSTVRAGDRAEKSRALCGYITGTGEWEKADIVLAFLPLPEEADLRPLITQALAAGKSVGLPRITGGELVFHRIESLKESLQAHPYGMLEPRADLPVLSRGELAAARTLVLTPGLAFDCRGGRLGRGKGYYDRFFRSLEGSGRIPSSRPVQSAAAGEGIQGLPAWGVCFTLQIVDEVPMGEGDRRVDGIVTEEGLIGLKQSS